MVHVLPRRGFEQEMCGKPLRQYVVPGGGSDPIALGLTDEPIHKQCIRNPVWNGLENDIGVEGQGGKVE